MVGNLGGIESGGRRRTTGFSTKSAKSCKPDLHCRLVTTDCWNSSACIKRYAAIGDNFIACYCGVLFIMREVLYVFFGLVSLTHKACGEEKEKKYFLDDRMIKV